MSTFDDFMISEAVNSNKEMHKLRAENATLRAELERLTSELIVAKDQAAKLDGLSEAQDQTITALNEALARLTGERDAHEQFLLNHPCGCLDGLTPGEIRLIARFHDRSDNLEEDLAQAQQVLRWISVTEKFPPIGKYVRVVIGGVAQLLPANLTEEGWEWADESADSAPKEVVTHWRELPIFDALAEAALPSDTPGATK